jgi:uncharacterized protein YecA (UPF0149 family)
MNVEDEDQKSDEASAAKHDHEHGPDCDHHHPVQQPFQRQGAKVGRNDPCSCGSGKKFKKCCGRS